MAIDPYVFDKSEVLFSTYESVGGYQEITVPTMLRDFILVSTRDSLLDGTGIKLNIYIKGTDDRVGKLYMDNNYSGPPCFNCHGYGNKFLDQLAQEREDNLGERFSTHFIIPFDPSIPFLFLDTTEHCYKLAPPTLAQQDGIFAETIQRIRRL
jgi:hypothetical protein